MPEDNKQDDSMALILAELRSLNRTLRMLASHLMAVTEAPPMVPTVQGGLPWPPPAAVIQQRAEHTGGSVPVTHRQLCTVSIPILHIGD